MEYEIAAIFRHKIFMIFEIYMAVSFIYLPEMKAKKKTFIIFSGKIYRCTDHSLHTPLMSIPSHQQNYPVSTFKN